MKLLIKTAVSPAVTVASAFGGDLHNWHDGGDHAVGVPPNNRVKRPLAVALVQSRSFLTCCTPVHARGSSFQLV